MRHLARSVVSIMAALQFAEGSAINPDYAVEMMEMLTLDLSRCTAEEKAALEHVSKQEYEAHRASGAHREVLEFYRTFVQVFVEGEPPIEDFHP